MNRAFGWLFIALLNLIVIIGAGLYVLNRTDNYIEEKRKQTLIYDIHSLRRQVIVPGQTYRRGNVTFKINKWGTRGQQPAVPKPENTFRIVAMGGSSVFDHLVGEGKSWPESLAHHLKHNKNEKVEAFNAGIPGFSSRETLAFYLDKWRYAQPDIAILYHGWNDVKYMPVFEKNVDADRFYSVKSWREQYKFLTAPHLIRNLYAIPLMYEEWKAESGLLQENKAPAVAKKPEQKPTAVVETKPASKPAAKDWSRTQGMEFFRKNVETFVQIVKADGTIPVLVAQNTLVTAELQKKDYNKVAFRFVNLDLQNLLAVNDAMADVLKKVALQHNVPFIDLRSQINGNHKYFGDHVHMAQAGSAQFSKLLAQELSKRIGNLEFKPDEAL